MRRISVMLLSVSVLFTSPIAHAANNSIDCSRDSLADAVSALRDKDKDLTIQFTGVCAGPVVVRTDGVTLKGVGTAAIDGGGNQDALTIAGAGRVSLVDFDVKNGINGIVAVNGAHVTVDGVSSHDNLVFGLTLQTGSSATLTNVTLNGNGVHGLDVETGSSATATGSLTASNNGVFGININASSFTISGAVTANGNTLGIQIATNANAFIADKNSSITASENHTVGLTVVSGAHMVSFGGPITVSKNPIAGVSLNSKAGLDLDAAAVLTSTDNGDGVLMQEGSVMTVFNTPAFSGANGSSTVDAHNNTLNGVSVQTGSTLTLANMAAVKSQQNGRVGLLADNGVGLTLVQSTLTGNTVKDLQLTFGTRADVSTTTIGTYTCDATVLARGTAGIACPH